MNTHAKSSSVTPPIAPPIRAAEWLNSERPLSLADLRGRVVVLHFFQMLCPGCVMHGVPQAVEIQRSFDPSQVVVIGIHSVFEHHSVMTPDVLRVFASEFRLTFPIAIDQPADDGTPIPFTMRAYGLQGTPSLVLIDVDGRVRATHFGHMPELKLGAQIGELLAEHALRGMAETG